MNNPRNTYEQVGEGGVFITYMPREARRVLPNRAMVYRVGYKTAPKAPWYDHGNKSFVGNMRESVPAAKAWAEERYDIKAWRRNGMGDWVDAGAAYLPLRCEVERKAARAASRLTPQSPHDAAFPLRTLPPGDED